MTPPPDLQDLITTVRQDTSSDSAIGQLITAAATVAQLEDTSDALLGHFVDRCRREGRSWSEISAALGVTKQAVHKRFSAAVADQIIAAIPAPTFERFTPRARSVLKAASQAAQAAGQPQVSSGYLLLGLFAEPEGLAARALEATGVSQEHVRAALPAAAGPDAQAALGRPGPAGRPEGPRTYTPDAKRVLRDALAVALELAHNYIGTEHLLLGLYGDPASPAARLLASAGASEDEVRAQVTRMLTGFRPPAAS
jgi:ATP-dependent Clp protease ATP-binding subunit ClpA